MPQRTRTTTRLAGACAALAACVLLPATPATAGTEPVLTPEQSAARIADNIKAAGGKPTAEGKAFLDAASAPPAPARAQDLAPTLGPADTGARRGGDSLSTVQLAVDANPAAAGAAASAEPIRQTLAARTPAACTRPSSLKRPLAAKGWAYRYYICGGGITAKMIWYCRPGSYTCQADAFFSDGEYKVAFYGGCSILNRYSCQLLTTARPGSFLVSVVRIGAFQGASGGPVIGDTWCAFF